MARVKVAGDGRLLLPKRYVNRDREWLLERLEDGLALRAVRPDARRAYVEITSLCNLNCAMCVRQVWRDEPGQMSWEMFQTVVEGLRAFPRLEEFVFGGYGEPLLHPRFPEMLRLTSGLGVKTTLTTNGLLLDESMADVLLSGHLDTVVVSLDTVHVQAYPRAGVPGGVERVLGNVRALRERATRQDRSRPTIGLEFVATRHSLGWLPRLSEVAQDLGAAFVLITNLLPHTEEMVGQVLYDRDEPLPMPTGWSVSVGGYLVWGTARLPRAKWGAYRHCRFVGTGSLVVGWDGGVSPCYPLMHSYPYYIYDRRKEVTRYILGKVPEQSLAEVWTSDEYVSFRARVREMRFPSCVDCGAACDYAEQNEDCWGNIPSCADCLWAQDIVRCP